MKEFILQNLIPSQHIKKTVQVCDIIQNFTATSQGNKLYNRLQTSEPIQFICSYLYTLYNLTTWYTTLHNTKNFKMLQHAAKFDRFYNIIGNFTAATQDKILQRYKRLQTSEQIQFICSHLYTLYNLTTWYTTLKHTTNFTTWQHDAQLYTILQTLKCYSILQIFTVLQQATNIKRDCKLYNMIHNFTTSYTLCNIQFYNVIEIQLQHNRKIQL